MTVEEILIEAKNPDNKRHSDNRTMSDNQLQLIFVELVPE